MFRGLKNNVLIFQSSSEVEASYNYDLQMFHIIA
jgi:hypothetical protein